MHLLVEMGARLQAERKRLGLTQEELAFVVGVSKRTLASYEAGSREPGAALLNHAVAAGVDIFFVVTGLPAPQASDTLSAEESRFVAMLRSISDSDKAVLGRTAEAFVKANSVK